MERIWSPRFECLPRDGLKKIQQRKLLRQIKHVYAYSDFYRKKFDQSGIKLEAIQRLDDISIIPPTTADELRASIKQGIDLWGGRLCVPEEKLLFCFSPPEQSLDENPLFTAVTEYDRSVVIEHLLREWAMVGIVPDSVVQSQCWGWEPLNMAYLSSYSSRYLSASVSDVMKCTIIPLEIMVSDVSRTVHSASFFRPQVIFTNLENMKAMEKEVEEQNLFLDQLGYRIIVLREREKVLKGKEKTEIEQRWGAKVYSMLDIQESLFYVMDCPAHQGLHVNEDAFLVEVIAPEGQRVEKPAEKGKLTITNLFSEATPLIRYQTDIEVSLEEGPCVCGRTGIRLAL